MVNDPDIVAFRQKIRPIVQDDMKEAEVYAKLVKTNGETIDIKIEHATGSYENPLTMAALEDKFTTLTEPIISKDQTRRLIQAIKNIETEPSLDTIFENAVKQE